jgi:hypothetical protein
MKYNDFILGSALIMKQTRFIASMALILLFTYSLVSKEIVKDVPTNYTHVFFNSTDYSYKDVKKGLENMNRIMQQMQGTQEGSVRFFASSQLTDPAMQHAFKKDIGVYDPVSDTIFINLDHLTFKHSNQYRRALVRLNETRYDIVKNKKIINKGPIYRRKAADVWSGEMAFRIKKIGGKKSMEDWLLEHKDNPDVLNASQQVEKIEEPVFI